MENGIKDSLVSFQTSQGLDLRGSLLRLNRFQIAFELYNPQVVLRASEVLSDFRIVVADRTLYRGNALVAGLVNAGTTLVCEAKLEEGGFNLLSFTNGMESEAYSSFDSFLGQWQRLYRVSSEFKIVVADMQTFLTDLRLWLEQVELQVRSAPTGNRLEMEQEAARRIGSRMVSAFDAMHERLEELSGRIEEEVRPVHQNFSKRQLHPLMLCSPFAYRTFNKPLGYAGDYEMVNMIVRDPYEGGSVFAKVVNLWFLSQWPAKAHRNRIQHLKSYLLQESLRAESLGRPLRVLNLGCGPAREIQEFMADSPLADRTRFTLLDFNEETIEHASRSLDEAKLKFGRRPEFAFQKKSVQQLLKETARPVVENSQKSYDFIYCAGLFDYLSDRICKQVTNALYSMVAPGGLLLATNVDDCKPFRHMLEFVLDWHLVYRDERKAQAILPERAKPEDTQTIRDSTSVNIFIEIRKPDHGRENR